MTTVWSVSIDACSIEKIWSPAATNSGGRLTWARNSLACLTITQAVALLAPRLLSHSTCTPSAVLILDGSSRDSLEILLQGTVAMVWVTRDDPLSYGGTQEKPRLGALLGHGMSPQSSPYERCHGCCSWMRAFEDRWRQEKVNSWLWLSGHLLPTENTHLAREIELIKGFLKELGTPPGRGKRGQSQCWGSWVTWSVLGTWACSALTYLFPPRVFRGSNPSPNYLQMALIKPSQALLRNGRNFPSQTGVTGNQDFLGAITLIRNVAWFLLLILQGTACPKGGHAAEKQGAIFACFSFL